jgi:queuine tRNA-ribosyltransferase
MEIQRTIGADIIMAFDECTPYPCDYRAQRSSKMTHRWLDRCVSHLEKVPVKYGYDQAFFLLYKEAVTKTYASNQRNIANSNQVANAIEDFQLGTSRRNVCYDRSGLKCSQQNRLDGCGTNKYFGKHSLGS